MNKSAAKPNDMCKCCKDQINKLGGDLNAKGRRKAIEAVKKEIIKFFLINK